MSRAFDQFESQILAARRGSASALGELIELCRSELLVLARKSLSVRLRAKCDPADLVQDTALEAHRDLSRFQGQTLREFYAWIRQILVNNAANVRRHYEYTEKREVGREVSLEAQIRRVRRVPDPALTALGTLLLAEQTTLLEQAYWQLPADMRLAIQLRSRTEASFAEIGLRLDRSPEAARKVWFRGVQRLKQVVGAEYETH